MPTPSQNRKIKKITDSTDRENMQIRVSGVDNFATVEISLPCHKIRHIGITSRGRVISDQIYQAD